MPAFNFQLRFAQRVRLGLLRPDHPQAKRQTIRARRADGRDPKPGQPLTLYTGQRTPLCMKLGETVLESRTPVRIAGGDLYEVHAAGELLTPDRTVTLARADGFIDIDAFFSFFSPRGEIFLGFIYRW